MDVSDPRVKDGGDPVTKRPDRVLPEAKPQKVKVRLFAKHRVRTNWRLTNAN